MARSRALTDMTEVDLVAALDEAKDDLLNLRFQNVTGQLDNNARLGQVRRDIARLMTELRQREIEAAEAAQTEETS